MKRSGKIDLQKMRKAPAGLGTGVKLSAVVAGSWMLTGCDSNDAFIYRDAQECTLDNPTQPIQCDAAYKRALSGWNRDAPRYSRMQDCEYDFGYGDCRNYQSHFIPLMAGFMLGEDESQDAEYDIDFDRPKGLTRSRSHRSPAYLKWVGARGDLYGDYGKRKVSVSSKAFKPTKGSSKVLGRGGFGKSVSSRASSSWGG